MNTTIAIICIISFGIISELFTWLTRNNSLFVRGYVSVIRILTLVLSICAIIIAEDQPKDVSRLQAANEFNYECIQHLDSLRTLQSSMIDDLADCLEQEYHSDIPQFDGDTYYNIHEQEQIIDSLYKSQE